MIKYGLILMTICLVASLILAVVFKITDPIISAQDMKAENAALSDVLPAVSDFKSKTLDGINYYEGYLKENIEGYVIKVESKGYSSAIEMLVGIDTQGKIMGIKILLQQETPGLGSKISEIKPGEKFPWFTHQLLGKDAAGLSLEDKSIAAISGATISSRAVISGIKKTVSEFMAKVKKER